MSCPWEQRLILSNRVAKIVPKATSGANASLTERSVLYLPSPRLQALVTFILPVTDPVLPDTDVLWMDAANAATFSSAAADWQIFPFPEPVRDRLTTLTESREAVYRYAEGLFTAENNGGFRYLADYHTAAKAPRNLDSYTISGETCARWLIVADLITFNDVSAPGYLDLQVEITPAPGITMSEAEWRHWFDRCQLRSLTSSTSNPPSLKCAAP